MGGWENRSGKCGKMKNWLTQWILRSSPPQQCVWNTFFASFVPQLAEIWSFKRFNRVVSQKPRNRWSRRSIDHSKKISFKIFRSAWHDTPRWYRNDDISTPSWSEHGTSCPSYLLIPNTPGWREMALCTVGNFGWKYQVKTTGVVLLLDYLFCDETIPFSINNDNWENPWYLVGNLDY